MWKFFTPVCERRKYETKTNTRWFDANMFLLIKPMFVVRAEVYRCSRDCWSGSRVFDSRSENGGRIARRVYLRELLFRDDGIVRFFPSAKQSYRELSRRNIFHGDSVRRAGDIVVFYFFFSFSFLFFFFYPSHLLPLSFSFFRATDFPFPLLPPTCTFQQFYRGALRVIAVLTGCLKKINLYRSDF